MNLYQQFIPRKLKFRKYQRRFLKNRYGKASNGFLSYGCYGLKSMEYFLMTPAQMETCRRVVKQFVRRRKGVLKLNVFSTIPFTSKPLEVRMGKGKGNIEGWICPVQKGTILFELRRVNFKLAQKILNPLKCKLPVKVSFVSL
jgi:large subunit ribosomal protein L16